MGEADYYRSQEIDTLVSEDLRRDAGEFWTCKDGRRLRPREMTTDHIRNAIALVERAYSKWCGAFGSPSPDGLEWCPRTPPIEEYCPPYANLIVELGKR